MERREGRSGKSKLHTETQIFNMQDCDVDTHDDGDQQVDVTSVQVLGLRH